MASEQQGNDPFCTRSDLEHPAVAARYAEATLDDSRSVRRDLRRPEGARVDFAAAEEFD
jgi:hypothetical protein